MLKLPVERGYVVQTALVEGRNFYRRCVEHLNDDMQDLIYNNIECARGGVPRLGDPYFDRASNPKINSCRSRSHPLGRSPNHHSREVCRCPFDCMLRLERANVCVWLRRW